MAAHQLQVFHLTIFSNQRVQNHGAQQRDLQQFEQRMVECRQRRVERCRTFAQLVDWRNFLEPVSARLTISEDNDEVRNRVHYGVSTPALRDSLVRLLLQANVPCDLIVITQEHPARFSAGQPHEEAR